MKERNWINLITSLKHNQCVLILGPDLSIDGALAPDQPRQGEPSSKLAEHLIRDLEDEDVRVSNKTLIAVTQQYEDVPEFGPSALRSRASRFYETTDFEACELHHLLATLPFRLIITTRHDSALAKSLEEAGKAPIIARYNFRGTARDNPELKLDNDVHRPLLFRLFGDPSEPESLVLSENDILDFVIAIASGRPALPTNLIRTLKTSGQSFLFVGFGIKDWYLRVLLKILLRVLGIGRSNFAVASESLSSITEADRKTTVLFFRRGRRVEIEDSNSLEFVAEVKRRLTQEAGVPARNNVTGPLIRTFICYAKEDGAIADELQSRLVAEGFDAWMDYHSLEGGEDWDARIKTELESTDFVLVIYSDALYRKTDSYVNKEIHLAAERALHVRGQYVIPLRTNDLPPIRTIEKLKQFQEVSLAADRLVEDVEKLVSILKRAYQRRAR